MEIKAPHTEADWKAYYALRYHVLREPWNQPLGSEVLQDEATAIHVMAIDEDGKALGVARMHECAHLQGQVRCVAVATDQQGKGIGKLIMSYLEKVAVENGCKKWFLKHAKMQCHFTRA
jgi:N-acetylglutamate synthase-like GNAT family acetyltransferase